MGRLILLPELPGQANGYQKAVAFDWHKLLVQPEDTVLAYAVNAKGAPPGVQVIKRSGLLSVGRFENVVRGRSSAELSAGALKGLVEVRSGVYGSIFCGDVIFYRALRRLFPQAQLTVRFHNFYNLLAYRQRFYRYTLGRRFAVTLQALVALEQEIACDPNVTCLFITPEEEAAFRMAYPSRETGCWNPAEGIEVSKDFLRPTEKKLVWFGGASAHKAFGLRYFVRQMFPELRRSIPGLELHMYGKGTEMLSNPAAKVWGHSFYKGDGFPLQGKGIYINPDLLGGGIKVKVGDWLQEGIPFISTPFGVEGYQLPESENILVRPIEEWGDTLSSYFSQ